MIFNARGTGENTGGPYNPRLPWAVPRLSRITIIFNNWSMANTIMIIAYKQITIYKKNNLIRVYTLATLIVNFVS